EFAKWCRSRDYDERKLAAPYRVSPQMTGYEELDEYGSWRAVPQYGEVWFPKQVASGWAPYREGHWVWVDPWGWNWVDDEPWGCSRRCSERRSASARRGWRQPPPERRRRRPGQGRPASPPHAARLRRLRPQCRERPAPPPLREPRRAGPPAMPMLQQVR